MSSSPNSTVYIGNLDERVGDRVLYDILIQAGRVVHLYIPRDKETDRPKGFAFAQYESEEDAQYAVKLFSGLVTLYNRTLRFAISGQDRPSPNSSTASPHTLNSSIKTRPIPVPYSSMEASPHSPRLSTSCRFSTQPLNHNQVSPGEVHQPSGYRSHIEGNNYDHSRRVFGATYDGIGRARLGRYDTSNPSY